MHNLEPLIPLAAYVGVPFEQVQVLPVQVNVLKLPFVPHVAYLLFMPHVEQWENPESHVTSIFWPVVPVKTKEERSKKLVSFEIFYH